MQFLNAVHQVKNVHNLQIVHVPLKNINILELGVREGISTKKFLEICNQNNGKLVSIDIDNCSKVSNDKRWTFIHSSDDNFEIVDKEINSKLEKDL